MLVRFLTCLISVERSVTSTQSTSIFKWQLDSSDTSSDSLHFELETTDLCYGGNSTQFCLYKESSDTREQRCAWEQDCHHLCEIRFKYSRTSRYLIFAKSTRFLEPKIVATSRNRVGIQYDDGYSLAQLDGYVTENVSLRF